MFCRIGILSAYNSKNLLLANTKCLAPTPIISISTSRPSETSTTSIPRPVRQEPSKVRLGFLPEEWFTFFYKKTGVTGPYTFGIALTTYLCSKEWYVMEHEFYNGLSMLLLCVLAVKKLGPPIAKYLDKEVDDYEASWTIGRKMEVEGLTEQIKKEEENQWSVEGQLMVVAAKRENVALQLEAAYRQRMMDVYGKVKRRLDFQVETQNVQRQIAQKNLVSWVVKRVVSSITPDQEKQNINKCIADLGLLAKTF